MGFMDKVKDISKGAKDKAVESYENAKEERAIEKERIQKDKDDQKALKDLFVSSRDIGDISVDIDHKLFKVKHASQQIEKKDGFFKKAGKATLALSTAGASLAVEMAMKPSDRIFRFEELKSYELLEDDSSVTSGGLGAAAVGGVALGLGGAVVGSLVGNKKQKKVVDNFVLKINTNDMYFPCILINYIQSSTKTSSGAYKNAMSLAQQSISMLDLIIAEEETSGTTEAPQVADPVEEVKKMKELLDMGIISEDEFEAKKKELLGL